MATFKKSAKKTTAKKGASASTAEGLTKTLSESAQQIWLAGMGAFGRAQSEGTRLFESLVKEGLNLEQTARKLAGGQADAVRGAMENKVGHARERAADTWDRLEKVFEDRVQRAMNKLGVPGRDDLNELSRRVDQLTAQLRQPGKATPAARAPAKRAAKASASKTAAGGAKPARKVAKAAKTAKTAKAPRKAPAKRTRKAISTPQPPTTP
ncbi:phasin family protein [Aerolutibacter ruishenii]|uniref:Poly(Hydroxyalkanoate) granule-associated protein n=1 Tax=Aerolutibacter ruishenii TaxID=686800 RepID=A0A562LVI6_9GAMM|nr:phasin family protein [Lysobacter ruishenii]TWI11645.1 poly(hydroxyalkanoate) granule-associated protein [Lysobacter ruishenii]